MKARIFSIEEFSVYDGPGIRTSVFFKGCPLNCNWCHSPEGREYKNISLRSPNGCLNCNKCVDVCDFKRENCIGCSKCVDVCPRNLIRMSSIDYDVNDLANLLMKNVNILNLNNGGITFSGGEPLMQYDSLKEVVKLLKGKTHLALQTCGYAKEEHFIDIINEMDLVLFDMKIMDKEKALLFEGVDNSLILRNLEHLKNSNTPFIIRIPLIPQVIDTVENLEEIIRRIKGSKNLIRVEVLPYNKYAGSKYKMANMKFEPMYDENVESNPHFELFEKENIEVRRL